MLILTYFEAKIEQLARPEGILARQSPQATADGRRGTPA